MSKGVKGGEHLGYNFLFENCHKGNIEWPPGWLRIFEKKFLGGSPFLFYFYYKRGEHKNI